MERYVLQEISRQDILLDQRELQNGSYGQVFRATWLSQNKPVVIKKFRQNSEGWREIYLLTEMRGLSHVVQIYGYCYMEDGSICAVLESAKEEFPSCKIYPLTIRRNYIHQIVCGLQNIHTNNIIHCDLKPQNLLIFDQEVKICDFGLSIKYSRYMDYPDKVLPFTPGYRAPEIMTLHKFSFPSDVWSVGCILYELMFGESFIHMPRDGEINSRRTIDSVTPVRGKTVPPPDVNGLHLLISRLPPKEYRTKFCRDFGIKLHRSFQDYKGVRQIYAETHANSEEERQEYDLLWKMLELRPNDRINVKDILCHPYFQQAAPIITNINYPLRTFHIDEGIFDYIWREIGDMHVDYLNIARIAYLSASAWTYISKNYPTYKNHSNLLQVIVFFINIFFSPIEKVASDDELSKWARRFGEKQNILELFPYYDNRNLKYPILSSHDMDKMIIKCFLNHYLNMNSPLELIAQAIRVFSRQEVDDFLHYCVKHPTNEIIAHFQKKYSS